MVFITAVFILPLLDGHRFILYFLFGTENCILRPDSFFKYWSTLE